MPQWSCPHLPSARSWPGQCLEPFGSGAGLVRRVPTQLPRAMAWRSGPPSISASAAPAARAPAALPSKGKTPGSSAPVVSRAEGTPKAVGGSTAASAKPGEPGRQGATGPLASQLDSILGAHIRVRTAAGRVLEGQLFALADGLAVLREVRTHTYLRADVHTVNVARITHLQVLGMVDGALPADAPLTAVDMAAVRARETAVAEELRMDLALVGDGVSSRGQAAFNVLRRVLGRQVEWRGKSILAHGVVVVDEPYTRESARVTTETATSKNTFMMVTGQLDRLTQP